MNIDKNVLSDNEGESIGSVGSYVQQYKDIEAGKISTAKAPTTYNKSASTSSKPLPKTWEAGTEKEIILHYCKRLGCSDFTDLDEKKGQIAASINRLFGTSLTPESAYEKISKHITQEDLFKDEVSIKVDSKYSNTTSTVKEKTKLNLFLPENNYPYKKGLSPLSQDQLELCSYLNQKDLVFSSDDYSFFLTVLPGKEKEFDKLFNFTQKEELVYQMFKEQLGDEHKAKKLVLMSRMMNEAESTHNLKVNKKIINKK